MEYLRKCYVLTLDKARGRGRLLWYLRRFGVQNAHNLFAFKNPGKNVIARTHTKRELLSLMLSVYEFFELLGEFLLNAIVMLPELWQTGTGWS